MGFALISCVRKAELERALWPTDLAVNPGSAIDCGTLGDFQPWSSATSCFHFTASQPQMHPSAMLSDGILLPMPLKISSM